MTCFYTGINYIRYTPASEIQFVLCSHLKSFVHLLFTSSKSFHLESLESLRSQSSGSRPEELMLEMLVNPLAASGKLVGTMKVKIIS